jgi:hypothetical protein
MAPHGTHRIKNQEEIEDSVWVADNGMGFEVSETLYRAKGYAPKLETLPWGKPENETLRNDPIE